MHLRPATPSDASDIATLHAESWRFAYRGALSDEYLARRVVVDREALWTERFLAPKANQYVAVAQTQGQLAGFACVFTAEHPEWGSLLDNIHVRATLQGKGIGTALLSSIARWCLSNAVHGGMYLWFFKAISRPSGSIPGLAHAMWGSTCGTLPVEVPSPDIASLGILFRRSPERRCFRNTSQVIEERMTSPSGRSSSLEPTPRAPDFDA